MRFADSLRRAMAEIEFRLNDETRRITVSIGAATWWPSMSSTSDLMRAKDAQHCRAKQAGRNRVCSALSE